MKNFNKTKINKKSNKNLKILMKSENFHKK